MRLLLVACFLIITPLAFSEPYFAVREGYDCSQCHVNPTGGGMRAAFGKNYAQTQLPAKLPDSAPPWSGELMGAIAVGVNARYSGREFDVDDTDSQFEFATDRANLYLSVTPNQYLMFYIDEQVSPGGAFARESWLKFRIDEHWYLKAGKFVLPFGWRLEDDQAFVRRVTGINFNTADNGLELGHKLGNWVSQFSITNGSSGAAENDDGKQLSLRSVYAGRKWQLGISANINDSDIGDKTLYGLFAGFNTGPVTWLVEWDRLDDDGDPLVGELDVVLLEANVLLSRGHNLKLSAESIMPESGGEPDQYRYSGQWEFFPFPYTQLRLGLRQYDSNSDLPQQNAEEFFIQLHGFF